MGALPFWPMAGVLAVFVTCMAAAVFLSIVDTVLTWQEPWIFALSKAVIATI